MTIPWGSLGIPLGVSDHHNVGFAVSCGNPRFLLSYADAIVGPLFS
jgi:hypothetical protein